MRLVFQTNLDVAKAEVQRLNQLYFPGGTFCVPRKGEDVEFSFKKDNRTYTFNLQVVDVTYNFFEEKIVVELHMPSPYRENWTIPQWSKWFEKFRYERGDGI